MSTEVITEKLDKVSKDLRNPSTVSEDKLVNFFDEYDIRQDVVLAIVAFTKYSLKSVGWGFPLIPFYSNIYML